MLQVCVAVKRDVSAEGFRKLALPGQSSVEVEELKVYATHRHY